MFLGKEVKKYQIELNLVKWGSNLRYDIRRWDAEHDNCGKGIDLTQEEYKKLIEILAAENKKETNSEDSKSVLPPDLF